MNFNEDQTDALREFINISLGASTANIAELLSAFATMHVPQISICNSEDFISEVQSEFDINQDYYVTKQLFTGEFGGECMFIISDVHSKNLGNHLYDVIKPSRDDITDAVIELTNILSSTIISRLAQELDTHIQFFVPSSQFVGATHIIQDEDISKYSKIIIIHTVLEFKDQDISGNVYILTKDETIISLRELIDNKLEELYS